MIQPSSSDYNIRGLRRAQVAPAVEDQSEAALEEFLSSWASGAPGSERMSLDQMLTIQASNPEVPQLAQEDDAVRQIEMLVSQNRTMFQTNSMTDGWNIAGQR